MYYELSIHQSRISYAENRPNTYLISLSEFVICDSDTFITRYLHCGQCIYQLHLSLLTKIICQMCYTEGKCGNKNMSCLQVTSFEMTPKNTSDINFEERYQTYRLLSPITANRLLMVLFMK